MGLYPVATLILPAPSPFHTPTPPRMARLHGGPGAGDKYKGVPYPLKGGYSVSPKRPLPIRGERRDSWRGQGHRARASLPYPLHNPESRLSQMLIWLAQRTPSYPPAFHPKPRGVEGRTHTPPQGNVGFGNEIEAPGRLSPMLIPPNDRPVRRQGERATPTPARRRRTRASSHRGCRFRPTVP